MPQLRIDSVPETEANYRLCCSSLALSLSLPLKDGRALLHPGKMLPITLSVSEAEALRGQMLSAGARVTLVHLGDAAPCGAHPAFDARECCSTCARAGCSLCVRSTDNVCTTCRQRIRRRRRWFQLRVAVLLSILGALLVTLAIDSQTRRARTAWSRTIEVAVITLPRDPFSPAELSAFGERLQALQALLAKEFTRHTGRQQLPFGFHHLGPVQAGQEPPKLSGDSWLSLISHNVRLWIFAWEIDSTLPDHRSYDARVYVELRRPLTGQVVAVEGYSQPNGVLSVVQVQLHQESLDFGVSVVGHELLHLMGASDKYDAQGKTRIPVGLAEPELRPLMPQNFVEIMARNRPISRGLEAPLESLSQLRVGLTTAQEIGWIAQPAR